MYIHRLKLGFVAITDKDLVTTSDSVKLSMTLNAKTFEIIQPAIDLFVAAYDAFTKTNLPPLQRSPYSSTIKNKCKETLIFELTMLGFAVSGMARNKKDVLIQSGFSLAKEGENAPKLEAMKTPSLRLTSTPTSLLVSYDKLSGADSYNIKITIAGSDKNWSQNSKTLSVTFDALPLGVELRVQVAGVNTTGEGEWSTTAVITLPDTQS